MIQSEKLLINMAESSSLTGLRNNSNKKPTYSSEHSEIKRTNTKDSDEVFEMYCETCYRDGIHVTAYAFCVSCVAYLCPTCLKYHGKFLPGHKYLEGDEIPLDICTEKCQIHSNEIIKFYCCTCSQFVCFVCKTENHADTCSMKYLPDIVRDLEKGEDFKELLTNKNEIAKQLTGTKTLLEKKYENISSTTLEAASAIRNEKEKLFAEFDREVFRIEEKIEVEKKKDNKRIDSVKENFDSMDTEIDHLTGNIKTLPKTQKYRLFIELKQLGDTLKRLKDSVECLKTDFSTREDAFESEVRVQAKDLIEKVMTFGTLIKSNNGNSEEGKDDKEQIKVVADPLDDINVRAKGDRNDCNIVDCCLLSEQFLVACDNSNCSLKLIDIKQKKILYVRPVKTHPVAATKICETELAMVQPYDKDEDRSIIQFLTLTKAKTLVFQKRYILPEMCCDDIAYINDGRLVVSTSTNHEGKLQILSLSGKVLTSIENNDQGAKLFSLPDRIALDARGKRLYVSDWYNDSITEIDIDNHANRKFSHRFWHPTGITTDKEGFIYVCEEGTGRVHVFHPDKSGIHILLDNISVKLQPCSLCFSLTENKLYMGQDDQDCIKVYKITDRDPAKNVKDT